MRVHHFLQQEVIEKNLCVGCGACVALDSAPSSMRYLDRGPIPLFRQESLLPDYAVQSCPGAGIHYPNLYTNYYGSLPENWLLGKIRRVRVGFSAHRTIRSVCSSGGVITQTLLYLLETGRIDAAIAVRQGLPDALGARAIIAETPEDILSCAQSVYIPVSMLDILKCLKPGKRYAMTCLPEQAAALRVMQLNGFGPAEQVRYVLGPYTGTALYPSAIRHFLAAKGVRQLDDVCELKWRAGEWPGHLLIRTHSGRELKTPKVYYNFLTPFFITQTSLQSMDFANEFADLAVGDAWSPRFERTGGGYSVFTTRTETMEGVVSEMIARGRLHVEETLEPLKASEMHGHMLDFKKRGGYLRNQLRRGLGLGAPDYGYKPARVPLGRIAAEIVISSLFWGCRTTLARSLIRIVPERVLGPLFNALRLSWKKISKPTKRKGLKTLQVVVGKKTA